MILLKKSFHHFLIVLTICLIIRLFLALTIPPGGDLATLIRWGNILADNGPVNFYQKVENEQLSGINSTFWAAAEIYKLSQKINLPFKEEFIFRLVPILADFANAYIIYALVKKFYYKVKTAKLVACLYLLNPAVFLMSSSLGQPDSFAMLFVFLSIYFLTEKKLILSSLFAGIGVATKPWPLLAIPIFLTYIFLKKLKKFNFITKINQIIIYCSIIVITVLIIFSPYKPYENDSLIGHMASRYLTMDRIQPYASKFTLNFWSLFTHYPQTDDKIFLNLSYRITSIIMFAIFYLSILGLFSIKFLKVQRNKNRVDFFNLLTLALCLAFLAMYLFLTRMLDRYLFFAVNLLYLASFSLSKTGKILATIFILANTYNILSTFYLNSLNWGQSYVILFSIFNMLFFFYLLFSFFRYKETLEKSKL